VAASAGATGLAALMLASSLYKRSSSASTTHQPSPTSASVPRVLALSHPSLPKKGSE